ncbi:hypothetical protein K438DRAFT_1816936 [Mycena galopus ATCC 62051]|nr:hypothetical protein K438DRAFT_1816936 [Mycena galopus ATCC 62051]
MRERPVYVSHPSLSISVDQKHLFYTSVIAGLSPAAQAAITSLRNVHPETPDVGYIRGIILTNALSTKVPHAPDGPLFTGLFEHLCRANHDCTPNAHYGFCTQTFSGRLFAVRSIAEGEEITIGYTDLMANGAARRKDLKAKFWFVCGCKTCCLPPAQAAESDARRDAIGEYFAKMKDKDRLPEVGSLERVKELLAWAEEDGLVEAASILGISAMRLARRTKNYLEELKLMIVSLNYLRAVEGSESPGFATLARRLGLNSKQLAAILDNSTPETIDYRFFEGLLAAQGSR